MRLIRSVTVLKAPADHQVIARWTLPTECGHELLLPPPPEPEAFEFLAFGDTGDSEAAGPLVSPQDAVAQYLADDLGPPVGAGAARFVLHMGDVVYMTGERRLYDRNFRRPYARLLTPESTVDELVFRVPFLPVPGNHDYYDMGRWAQLLSLAPGLGLGLRTLARQFFAYNLSQGGSDQGRVYMERFVRLDEGAPAGPLPYLPGEHTRLPNRYYRFTYGCADFFALDSNTLVAPPPSETPLDREAAVRLVAQLQGEAKTIDRELRRDRAAVQRWVERYREGLARGRGLDEITEATRAVTSSLLTLLRELESDAPELRTLSMLITAAGRWAAAARDLESPSSRKEALRAIAALDGAGELCLEGRGEVEDLLSTLSAGPERERIVAAGAALEQALRSWSALASGEPPAELCRRLQELADAALDAQRELVRERQRARSTPADHDAEQLRWLEAALEESERERPDHWRIVYLHHPLWTTVSNHCEHRDVQGVRANLLARLKGKAHLVLGGHAHAFEWLRSHELPHAGVFVTGGGGQISLRRSVLDPRRIARHRERYAVLRARGVRECAVGGRGPAAADGAAAPLYHYLRVIVTPTALRVIPVGVRRAGKEFRSEAPMPVYHAPHLPQGPPPWHPRALREVRIYRDRPPEPVWD